jgi:hypothetical protein
VDYRADDLLAFDMMFSVNPMIGISQFGFGVSWLLIGCSGNFDPDAGRSGMEVHPEEHLPLDRSVFS